MEIVIILGIIILVVFFIKSGKENSKYSKSYETKDIHSGIPKKQEPLKDEIDDYSYFDRRIDSYTNKDIHSDIPKKQEPLIDEIDDYSYFDSLVDPYSNIDYYPTYETGFFKIITDNQEKNLIKGIISDYLIFEEDFKEKYREFNYDANRRYLNSTATKTTHKEYNTTRIYLSETILNFAGWSFSERETLSIGSFINRIVSIIGNRKDIKILLEIDLHQATKREVEDILNFLMERLEKYRVRLTFIHGYRRGTILQEYIRGFKHSSIKSIEIPNVKGAINEGRTIYNIENEETSFSNYLKSEKERIKVLERESKGEREKERELEEKERALVIESNSLENREKQFRKLNPKLFEKRECITNRLYSHGISLSYVKMYSIMKKQFESSYYRIKSTISVNGDNYDMPDYDESMFDDFYFSKLGRMINIDNNRDYDEIDAIVSNNINIRQYIIDERDRRLKIEEEYRVRRKEINIKCLESEKLNRPKKIKELEDSFYNIKVNSIIYHKKYGILKVIDFREGILYTDDSNGDNRRFIYDLKILNFIDDIKN